MGDRTDDSMDLDLNLGPVMVTEAGPSSGETVNLDAWVETPFHRTIREALRPRIRQRWRWRHLQMPIEAGNPLHLMVDSDGVVSGGHGAGSGLESEGDGPGDGGGALQAGEGSVAAEERTHELVKTCENHVSLSENGSVDDKERAEKSSIEEGSFFDCNICLDLAHEPVVTCCGHLFCWPCIYSWLHVHSDAKECPVCKGEVTDKTLIPIYGRGNHTHDREEDSGVKIPARPSAKRVESIRQTIQRAASSFTLEEIIRRVGARFEDFFQLPGVDGNRELLDRSFLLNRILTSRAMRREQNRVIPSENVIDLTQDRAETSGQRRLPPLTYRRGQSHRGLEPYLRRSPPGQSQEPQPPSGDDRDSVSSIAAVIHGETFSTSSSRRRNDASRASDVDSGESRALRRRRLI